MAESTESSAPPGSEPAGDQPDTDSPEAQRVYRHLQTERVRRVLVGAAKFALLGGAALYIALALVPASIRPGGPLSPTAAGLLLLVPLGGVALRLLAAQHDLLSGAVDQIGTPSRPTPSDLGVLAGALLGGVAVGGGIVGTTIAATVEAAFPGTVPLTTAAVAVLGVYVLSQLLPLSAARYVAARER